MKLTRGTLVNAGIALLACASVVAVVATRNVASTKDGEGRAQNLLSVFRVEDATRPLPYAGQSQTGVLESGLYKKGAGKKNDRRTTARIRAI